MCSSCTLLDKQDNNFRNTIVPLAFRSQLILRSVLAVAAKSLATVSRSSAYETTALTYFGDSVFLLHRLLSCPNAASLAASRTEILSTIFMLCLFDLSSNGGGSWMLHLQGARKIIELYIQSTDEQDTAIIHFLGQYFASHSILAYTAISDPNYEQQLWEGATFWSRKVERPACEVNCFTGCSNKLMEIILTITHAIRTRYFSLHLGKDDQSYVRKQDLEKKLNELSQSPTPSPGPSISQNEQNLHSSETASPAGFRIAALLLLQYLEVDAEVAEAVTKSCVRAILDLMPAWIEQVRHSHTSSIWRARSLWPYFIAACHVTGDEERILVLSMFREMAKDSNQRFRNVTTVQQIVETLWKRKDLECNENAEVDTVGRTHTSPFHSRHAKSRGFCFAWEEVMAYLDCDLSWT
ncbi:hypothetical protein BP5796_09280 [Coleophoma crateriformis]|uniref:Uncharacterized protein n=1 Tax=Coleophoma crateriformis TaxID=565419 RepID=A0A3D8R3J4_9HELO|nr:hypothetical protein BP5796_09280 [Coleophoma crateriformis]